MKIETHVRAGDDSGNNNNSNSDPGEFPWQG